MKKFIYTLIIGITMFIGVNGVEAKETEKTCTYYFYNQLSGDSVSLEVSIYDDLTSSSVITYWNQKNKNNKEKIQNWDDVKNLYQTDKKCPDHALVKKDGWGFAVWLSNDKEELETIQKNKNYDSSNSHIANSNEYVAPSDNKLSQAYYKKIEEFISYWENNLLNFDVNTCMDKDKYITRTSECKDILLAIKTSSASAYDEIMAAIKMGYVDENDDRVKNFLNLYKTTALEQIDRIQNEIDAEDEKVRQEMEEGRYSEEEQVVTNNEVLKIVQEIYNIIKILIPVLIIALSIVDFLKVILMSDDKNYKSAWDKFIKRLIIGVIFFLVPIIVSFILKYSGIETKQSYLEIFK